MSLVTYAVLPADLPAPVDDGACNHLPGMRLPPDRSVEPVLDWLRSH